jgi:predicted GH43/DUF377 family glycosyl hydrolase
MFFPDVVLDPQGNPALALLHRPTYLVHRPDGTILLEVPGNAHDERESIWIAYISLEDAQADIRKLVHVYGSELLATPEAPWESLKIGGAHRPSEPLWLAHLLSRGQRHRVARPRRAQERVLRSRRHGPRSGAPDKILYRSPRPALEPELHTEMHGIVPNVVFPTAIDVRGDGLLDVYYGMADSSIGVATTTIPDHLAIESQQ